MQKDKQVVYSAHVTGVYYLHNQKGDVIYIGKSLAKIYTQNTFQSEANF